MAGHDGGLHLVRAGLAPAERGVELGQALGDAPVVPRAAVLVLERHEVAGGVDPGVAAGVVQQHQREEAACLRLVGHELHQDAARGGSPRRTALTRTRSSPLVAA